jgi:hypothetical protein
MGKFSSSQAQVKKTKTLSKVSSPPVSYQAARCHPFFCLSSFLLGFSHHDRALKVATVTHHAIKCLLKIAKNIKVNQIRKKLRKEKEIQKAEGAADSGTISEIKKYIQEMKVRTSSLL